MEITFEKLPDAVSKIYKQLQKIEKLVSDKSNPESDRWFNLSELCDYLPDKPARVTIYKKVSSRTIPYHKRGKRLYFLKSEIDLWLKEGRHKTTSEIKAEVDNIAIKSNKAE